ncbi:hypothetical protein K440DRAFT_636584 [Wilcoxina mikolae CBS 423.85]|nr:hypothetical protein K440DRAFT_636584 [Wilcoxina mikolae CBS 423.85]
MTVYCVLLISTWTVTGSIHVGIEVSFSLGRDVIGWHQVQTLAATLQQKVVVRQWACSNSGQLADASTDRLTQNDAAVKAKSEQLKLRKPTLLTDFLYWSKKSQQFHTAQKGTYKVPGINFIKSILRVDREVGTTDIETDSDNDTSYEGDLWENTDFNGKDKFEEEENDMFAAASATTVYETEDEPDVQLLAAPIIRTSKSPTLTDSTLLL